MSHPLLWPVRLVRFAVFFLWALFVANLRVDEDTRTLYVHALYVDSRASFLAQVERLETVLLDVTRLRGAPRGSRGRT
jgi:multisubunit Na+/H+ antiporter MnhE subunit